MKHVASVSFTASIGLMAIFAVDFIDMIFIAMLGNQALAAAVGYAGTILFFTTSISIGLSIAAGALVARSLAQRKSELAREYATSVMMVALLVALATVVFVWFQLDNLLSFLGADTETKQLASEYLKIIIPSMPLLTGAMISTAVLRAHGDAKRAMWATLIGGLVNAVLDPILIFTFGLDLQGAALASVIARATMLVAAARPAIQLYNGFCLPSPSKMGNLIKRDINRVSSIAGPAVLTNIATPVGSAIVIREMAHYGTDIIAGMAIIARLTPVSFALVFALSGAIGPILGQNFGAGLFERVKETFKSSLLFTLAYVLLIATLLYLIRQPIASLFNAKGDT
ncbi:MAG: MATE family efflux transporter, partial [Methylococcales bacterium]|nr:MATE family efflux transporter [Methylococcales bacterium]